MYTWIGLSKQLSTIHVYIFILAKHPNCAWSVRHHHKCNCFLHTSDSHTLFLYTSIQSCKAIKAEMNLVITSAIIIALIIIAWVPNQLWHTLYSFHFPLNYNDELYPVTLLIIQFSSCVNPFIIQGAKSKYEEKYEDIMIYEVCSMQEWIANEHDECSWSGY